MGYNCCCFIFDYLLENLPMKKFRKDIIAVIVLVLAGQTAFGSALQDKIEQILARKDQKNVEFSISVLDPNTGDCIYSYNPTTPLTPASNMKLVTSFTTLKQLGLNYKFVTKAVMVGNKLVVIGGGDPLLGFEGKDFISQTTEALKEKGVNQIEKIIIDSSIFDNERTHPNWPKAQLNRPYASEICGINYNGNCIKISASQSAGEIKLTKEPDTEFLKLLNNIKLTSKGDTAIGSNRTEKENTIVVYGKYRTPASFDVAIERPAIFFGYMLSESIGRAGIIVQNPLTEEIVNEPNMQIIAELDTPIMEVIQNCNKDSLQIAAECMLKALAAQTVTNGKDGSWQGGRTAISNYLTSLGIDKAEFYIDDGSGLSNVDKLSSNVISKVLLDAYESPLWPAFKQTLAIGGVDGTIKKQFYKDKYKNRVFAKTGYINGVRALSGMCVTSGSQKKYIFSIITNKANYPTKKTISDIVEAIIDSQ